MAYTRKLIDVSFGLASGSFGGTGLDQLTLKGLRVSAKVTRAGGTSFGQLQASIYGLTLSQMNTLSTLGFKVQIPTKNTITLRAGDEKGMQQVFAGTIYNAYADLNQAPQVAFIISAQAALFASGAKADTLSFGEGVKVATICQNLADQMSLKFENNGVDVNLPPTYLSGSATQQLYRVCEAANISYIIDNGVLAIWPKNGSRKGTGAPPLLSRTTGMVGYPTYTQGGIHVKCMWNPSIEFGKEVQVQSDQTPANGLWTVYNMDVDLDSNVPGGNWFMNLDLYNPKFGLVVKT